MRVNEARCIIAATLLAHGPWRVASDEDLRAALSMATRLFAIDRMMAYDARKLREAADARTPDQRPTTSETPQARG